MSQFVNSANRSNQFGRHSSVSTDENFHSINGAALSLQAFVDDIPFQFNTKYQTIIVPNIDIPEYDTTKIRDILAESVDFTLENKVLVEALEDLQRKKKEIEADTLRQHTASPSTVVTNNPATNSMPILSNTNSVNYVPPPPLNSLLNSQPTVPPLPLISNTFPVTPLPPPQVKPSISPSYRLPSVRDIYWPTSNQQQYTIPPVVNPPSTIVTTNTLSLPTPIHSTNSSPNSVKTTDRSFNNCDPIVTNDLTATFDGTLGSDDPFHDAELKSLNDMAELRHLYSAIGSANTVRR